MYVLGVETSCDETAVAIIRYENSRGHILSDQILSQTDIHEAYGGIVPELASRAHLKNLPVLLDLALKEAGISLQQLGLIGVTVGPGLKGCLLMGCSFAKALSVAHATPLLGVNHIEAHVQVVTFEDPEFQAPYLGLIVSGGHTEIVLVKDVGTYELIARTNDDAAGEAFDKSAHLLGFSYPGGPQLARLADSCEDKQAAEKAYSLPKVMREQEGFSFSGLKTAISLLVKKLGVEAVQESSPIRAALCWIIQAAIVDALIAKLERAVRDTGIRKIAVSGGVAANLHLRERCKQLPNVSVRFPKIRYCMDNAVMIAHLAQARFQRGQRSDLDLSVRSRWPMEES